MEQYEQLQKLKTENNEINEKITELLNLNN